MPHIYIYIYIYICIYICKGIILRVEIFPINCPCVWEITKISNDCSLCFSLRSCATNCGVAAELRQLEFQRVKIFVVCLCQFFPNNWHSRLKQMGGHFNWLVPSLLTTLPCPCWTIHYSGVIMGAMASRITGVSMFCLKRAFRRRSKKTWKLRVTGLGPVESPTKVQ